MFNSIVVAFDGSPFAEKALATASELAAQGGAALGIAYVIETGHARIPQEAHHLARVEHLIEPAQKMVVNYENAPIAMMDTMAQVSQEYDRAMEKYAEFLLGQAESSAREAGVTEVDTRTLDGDAAAEIVAYAKERDADLIVSGCRGFGRVKSLLLGSTSHKIGQLAECSCLTVK